MKTAQQIKEACLIETCTVLLERYNETLSTNTYRSLVAARQELARVRAGLE